MIISEQDKPSLEELRHYGVLGMKWGKTRAKSSGATIKDARNRLRAKQTKIFEQEDKRDVTTAGSASRKKETKKLNDMMREFDKDPARVLATRTTRGEKALLGLFSVGTFGIPFAVGVGITSAVSRRIERKQETGAYDKKKYNF
jgi:hypothetical protein